MIVDICFTDLPPIQIQGIRLITVYPNVDSYGAAPELVLHFKNPAPQQNLPMANITTFTISED